MTTPKYTTKGAAYYGPYGTRKVIRKGVKGHYSYHVVCATCDAGGTVGFPTQKGASMHAINRSGQPCRSCGAD